MDVSDDTTIDEVLPPYATPNPYPARGIYGFALFLISSILFALYLIWALVPTPWLNTIQFTYVPAKYWAVAIPLLFPLTVVVYVTAVFAINLINFHGVFDDIEVIENDFGDLAAVDSVLLKKFPKTTDTEKSSFGGSGKIRCRVRRKTWAGRTGLN